MLGSLSDAFVDLLIDAPLEFDDRVSVLKVGHIG
jgi:hypothetical protein